MTSCHPIDHTLFVHREEIVDEGDPEIRDFRDSILKYSFLLFQVRDGFVFFVAVFGDSLTLHRSPYGNGI